MVHLQRRKRIAAFSVGPSGLTVTSLMLLLLLIVCILGCIFHSNYTNLFEKTVAKIVSAITWDEGAEIFLASTPPSRSTFGNLYMSCKCCWTTVHLFNIFKIIQIKRKLGFVQLLTNRCQCGAVGAAWSAAADPTSMSKKKIEKERNWAYAAKSDLDKTLAEPQASYLPCPCMLCPCIIDRMLRGRRAEP